MSWADRLTVALLVALALAGCGGKPEVEADRCPPPQAGSLAPLSPGQQLMLHDGWSIRSSDGLDASGSTLSTTCFHPGQAWQAATVPSTVLAALIADGVYPDPDVGANLRKIPGADYGLGLNFSNFPMPAGSPFKPSWWYRVEFALPPSGERDRTYLHFKGINYKANIWLNGKLVADETQIAGMYRRYDLDVTGVAAPGRHNVLAVQVTAPSTTDLADTFIDWNPMPPDKNMGIWHDVYVTTSGPVTVRHPMVKSKVSMPSLDSAALTVEAVVENRLDEPVSGTLTAKVGSVTVSEDMTLDAHEKRAVQLDPAAHPELVFDKPQLWWPYQLGQPHLYDLALSFKVDGKVSDSVESQFGIRETSATMTKDQHLVYSVNGQRLLVRGAGYTSDMMLRFDDSRDEKEMRLVKDMGLNAIRLEGKLADDHLLDVTDREGILVIAGWECCNIWERFIEWGDDTKAVAKASMQDQIYRLRGRASLLSWWNGSDHHPRPDVEKTYIAVLKAENWPNPYQASADEEPSDVTGATGVKMTGPYDYVPPVYWYIDKDNGGAFGFNTETSPGPAVPNVESIDKFIPSGHRWPFDDVWKLHCGGIPFDQLDPFTKAMNARYGKAKDLADYAMKSQVLAYDGERAMFEAFRRNKYTSTGVIQWMLNDAWPSFIWHLYDYYLSAGGGYYGTKKANQTLHIQYSYDDRSVVVANALGQGFQAMKASVEVYDFNLTKLFSQAVAINVPPDSSTVVLKLPDPAPATTTWFVKLTLQDSAGKVASDNFYWLSTRPDKLDWDNTSFQYTPTLQHGDLTELDTLPDVTLDAEATQVGSGASQGTAVTVNNPSKNLAFMVELRLVKGKTGGEVLPSTWSDNYFTLLPDEQRQVVASYAESDLEGAKPTVKVTGWNVDPATLQPK